MKFEWHGTKAATNLRKHGVSFDEAATVFADGLSYVFPDPGHSDDETRFLIIGISEAGGSWLSLTRTEESSPGSYQHGKQHERSEIFMKKTAKAPDELRPEYDFASMPGGVRGKYAARYRQGVNIVKLDDDVSAAFPDAKTVNDALRSLIRIAQTKVKHRPRGDAADL